MNPLELIDASPVNGDEIPVSKLKHSLFLAGAFLMFANFSTISVMLILSLDDWASPIILLEFLFAPPGDTLRMANFFDCPLSLSWGTFGGRR